MYGYRSRRIRNYTPKQSVFGIPVPSNKGSLAERIAERTRYYSLLDDQQKVVKMEKRNPRGRSLTHDTGNEMVSIKLINSPAIMRGEELKTRQVYRGPLVIQSSPHAPGFVPVDDSLIRMPLYQGGGVSGLDDSHWAGRSPWPIASDIQGSINRMFASSIPDNPGSKIGETLFSLLKGDFPRLLKNWQNFEKALFNAGGASNVRRELAKITSKEAGSQYLNVIFGWTPTIGDIVDFVKTCLNLDAMIFGESFRRHRRLPSESRTANRQSTGIGAGMSSPFLAKEQAFSAFFGGSTPCHIAARSSWDHKLSARYAGVARTSPASRGYVEKAHDFLRNTGVIYDTIIWDLTPYSWLLDWFVTMGKSIDNAQAFSPLTGRWNIDYAYVTTFYRVTSEIRFNGPLRYTWRPNTPDAMEISISHPKSWGTSVVKHRRQATPFGFGTDLSGLSTAQYSILVALGLAKIP